MKKVKKFLICLLCLLVCVCSVGCSDKRIIENNYQEDLSEIESKIRALILQR